MEQSQLASHMFVVRPANFGFNEGTASTNHFQTKDEGYDPGQVAEAAREEFEGLVAALEKHQIDHVVFDDTPEPVKTDAVFPNNWITLHHDGSVVLYPMMAESRRLERRMDIIGKLEKEMGYQVNQLIDLSHYEKHGRYLEGSGSIIFDYVNRIAYAARSERTNLEVLERVTEDLGFQQLVFDATDAEGQAIYHTNVLMSLGKDFAVLCEEAVEDADQRALLRKTLNHTDHQLISITREQMNNFCGNIFPVVNQQGKSFILMSQTAHDAFTLEQRVSMAAFGRLLPVPIPTIEKYGGGSIRCMIAGNYLPKA